MGVGGINGKTRKKKTKFLNNFIQSLKTSKKLWLYFGGGSNGFNHFGDYGRIDGASSFFSGILVVLVVMLITWLNL